MTDDLQRLANAVIARRVELGMRTTTALGQAMNVSVRLLNDVENARRRISAPYYAALEQALRWESGSVEAVLAGKEPTVVGGGGEDADFVAAPGERQGEGNVSNAELLAEIRALRREVDELKRHRRGDDPGKQQ